MRISCFRTAALFALAVFSSVALAAPSARVGRLALVQGQVSIANAGQPAEPALLNWPVTSGHQISTGAQARAELRVGQLAVRLDADSALEVSELGDDTMRLRLHYGSASIRVRRPELQPGFELSTPQGRVRMQEPGLLRVDTERVQDTSVFTAFEGVARIDSDAGQFTLLSGKRAELHNDDLRTSLAVRDSFDDWSALRDARDTRDEPRLALRYLSPELTGYEELERYGDWREDEAYGPLWFPRGLAADWAPYRDGRWTWVAPWGWTWIDATPWGYAPSHYGRWVKLDRRWCWAPGRHQPHPVWAPALVGWIGGGNWHVQFNSRGSRNAAPAVGWYPLGVHDAYRPWYDAPERHVARINSVVVERREHRRDHRRDHYDPRRDAVTIVPHGHFGERGTVVVSSAPRVNAPTFVIRDAPALATPLAPPPATDLWRHERTGRGNGNYRDPRDEPRNDRPGQNERSDWRTSVPQRPANTPAAPTVQSVTPDPVNVPRAADPRAEQRHDRDTWRDERGNRRDQRDNWRNERVTPTPVVTAPAVSVPMVAPQSTSQPQADAPATRGRVRFVEPQQEERRERGNRDQGRTAPALNAPEVPTTLTPPVTPRTEPVPRPERTESGRGARFDTAPARTAAPPSAPQFAPQFAPQAAPAPSIAPPPAQANVSAPPRAERHKDQDSPRRTREIEK